MQACDEIQTIFSSNIQYQSSMKRQNLNHSRSSTYLRSTALPQQFRELGKSPNPPKTKHSKREAKDRSFSDSDSSDSCLDKKYYRCGCLSQHGCHQHYRDYLSELRMARLTKQHKPTPTPFEVESDRLSSLSLSDTERQEGEGEGEVCTPKKRVALDRIVQINESAEYSKRKNFNSITITLQGKKYYKTFTSKEEVLECFNLLESMLNQ